MSPSLSLSLYLLLCVCVALVCVRVCVYLLYYVVALVTWPESNQSIYLHINHIYAQVLSSVIHPPFD